MSDELDKAHLVFEQKSEEAYDGILEVIDGLIQIRDCAIEGIEPRFLDEKFAEYLVFSEPKQLKSDIAGFFAPLSQAEEKLMCLSESQIQDLLCQIDSKDHEIALLEKNLKDLQGEKEDLESTVLDLSGELFDLRNQLSESQKEIEELNSMIEDAFGENVANNFQAARRIL